ncbi:MAG TPA: ATP-grasp domain-containing protein [Candidatus Paceibacterota bacterium]|nr:ATP-grasp domain-containing protein [Candidatus Paceibacterota bacterium]
MYAIVLDGQLKSALAATRSLGSAGVAVWVGAERATGMALHSKYATHRFTYPSPYVSQEAFAEEVIRVARLCAEKPVLYAFSDATYLSLYMFRHRIAPHAYIEFPEEESVHIAFDKAATYSLARISGIPTIPTHIPAHKDELHRIAMSASYPMVVKTRRSVTWRDGVGVFGSASFVHSPQALIERCVALLQKTGEMPLIQEFVRGEEYGVEMLAKEGHVYAVVAHHRIRSLSPTGGASVLKETLDEGVLYRELCEHAETLVKKLSWTGPIMVEFKVEQDTRTPYLMEINGRFWGSLPLSIYAGVDVPVRYYEATVSGGGIDVVTHGSVGVVSIHRLGDVYNLFRVLFAKDVMRAILYPRRTKAIRDFFRLPPRTRGDVWWWRDPKPALMEIVDTFAKMRGT